LLRTWFAVDVGAQGEGENADHTPARWSVLGTIVLLTGASLLIGLHPPLLARLCTGVVIPPSLFTLLRGTTLAQAAAITLPLAGGIALLRYRAELVEQMAGYWDATAAVLRLEWLARALNAPWSAGRELLRAAGEIGVEQGDLGWVALVGLLVLLYALK
jgi:hypothetical protein